MQRRQLLGALGSSPLLPGIRLGDGGSVRWDLGSGGTDPSAVNLGLRAQGDTGPAGGQATIGLAVGNDGDDPASDVSAYFRADGGTNGNTDYFGENFDVGSHEDDDGEWLYEGWHWDSFPAETRQTPQVTLDIASSLPAGEYVFEVVLEHGDEVIDVENPVVTVESGGGEAELVLEMTDDTARPGGVATIDYILTNVGDARATGLQGYLTPPSDGWDLAEDPGEFTSLDPGASETLHVPLTVPEDASGTYTIEGYVRDDAGHEARDRALVTVSRAVTGTLVDVHGDPVPDAVVRFFDVADRRELGSARTEADGTFSVSGLDPSRTAETLLLARKEITEDVGGESIRRDWFRSRVYGGGPQPLFSLSPSLGTIPLDRELLFAPTAPTDNSDEPLGMVSMWRFVGSPYQERYAGFSEPTDQVFYIEVTNVNRDDFLGPDGPDHAIHRNAFYDLASGSFSLTLPQDGIVVDYGAQSTVDLGGSVSVAGVDTGLKITSPADWHPTRTDLPLYEAVRSLEAAPFQELSTTDAERVDRIEEGFGRMLGTLPVVGTVFSLFDTIDWAFGDALDRFAEISVPVAPSDTNPNTHDNVILGWESDNARVSGDEASVVFAVPLRFTAGEDASFVGQAEWLHTDDEPGGPQDGHGFFRWQFGRGPTGHVDGGSG